ncbi:vWA domain-containing protein [Amycolatopsis sp. Hca4]|uniref:vWA domain-containing protein n=1 Tax=Amycolatopsis sp. Hca4 TaxID=2742131 RepID=UPI0015922DD8|nr:vWA domain-containing protein [Amycolatopsis sp. Hca4]QKV79931.1 VWA domain-containing protein [Amycolatopsis sp. Hca4]
MRHPRCNPDPIAECFVIISHGAWPGSRGINAAFFLLGALLVAVFGAVGPASADSARPVPVGSPVRQQEPLPQVQPARLVILVDESGSISPDDLDREREAAAMIGLGEFAPGSSVSVVGFGSDNTGSQLPVDAVCEAVTVKTAQDQQSLADCVAKLRKRNKADGDGTDHYAAMQQAMTYLSDGPPGSAVSPKMVFMLTDGNLDVSASPRYGRDNVGDQRNQAALRGLDGTLATATKVGVQVWPLGFGNVNKAQLDRFAAGGFQGTCSPSVPRPAAAVAADSRAVADFLLKAFGSARCAGSSDIQRIRLGAGDRQSVTVSVPEIATDGSIVVVKQDAKVTVSVFDPSGREVPKSGRLGDSVFQDSGANGPVESLRITNPDPGNWTVKLTSLPGSPDVEVSAVVIWQGAIRASLTVDPPAPRRGQPVRVLLTLQTRNRPIRDPVQLAGLVFAVRMTSGTAELPVRVADAGTEGDDHSGDGIYTGSVVIPDSDAKSVTFTGTVEGVGVSGDTRTVTAQVSQGRPRLTGQIAFDAAPALVPPGGSVAGLVTVTSVLPARAKVQLQITELAPGTRASVPADRTVFEVPATGRVDLPFTVTFAKDTASGTNRVVVSVVDTADPASVLTSYPLTVDVGYPPEPPPWPLYLGTGGAVVVVAAVLLWLRARKRRREVRGLAVFLFVRGRQVSDIAAPESGAIRFRFVVHSDEGMSPQLAHPVADEPAYRLVRDGGQFRLSTPFGEQFLIHDGERCPAGEGLELEIRDERRRQSEPADGLGTEQPAETVSRSTDLL